MRIALTAILTLHGLIHALGVLKWWKLAPVTQLSGRTLVPLPGVAQGLFGLFWLLALLLLLGAAGLRTADQDAWWALALVGVVISQALVVVAWPDAKAGTVANIIVLVPTLMAAAHASFDRRVAQEVRLLLAVGDEPQLGVVQPQELDRLPAPVRRWLEASGVVGRERAHTVRLQQRGLLRTAPDKPWMPARAVQYFSVERPGFVWQVDATMMNVAAERGRPERRQDQRRILAAVFC